MQQNKTVDVVIAGGGFVGLTLAKEITARTSLSVSCSSAARRARRPIMPTDMDELDYALRYRMMQNLAEETATHRHPRGRARCRSVSTDRSIPAPA